MKEKILLHTCCAPCLLSIVDFILEKYDPIIYFFNPNISPREENIKRNEEVKKVIDIYKLDSVFSEEDNNSWDEYVKGYESVPEGGLRCELCFKYRLGFTSSVAQKNNIKNFSTTISTSKYKNDDQINKIGIKLQDDSDIKYIHPTIDKTILQKKSLELTKKHGIYRQKYCGCKYSIRN